MQIKQDHPDSIKSVQSVKLNTTKNRFRQQLEFIHIHCHLWAQKMRTNVQYASIPHFKNDQDIHANLAESSRFHKVSPIRKKQYNQNHISPIIWIHIHYYLWAQKMETNVQQESNPYSKNDQDIHANQAWSSRFHKVSPIRKYQYNYKQIGQKLEFIHIHCHLWAQNMETDVQHASIP